MLIKNFAYTITSNIIATVISVIIVAILPNSLGTTDYGYYQLFLFYVSYVGVIHFGLNDGIYLLNSGNDYSELNKEQLHYQFILELLFLSIISLIGSCLVFRSSIDENRQFVIIFALLYMITSNLRGFLLNILQITNRIKHYSIMNVIGRCLFIILVMISLLFKCDFKFVIIADSFGRFVSLIIGMWFCSDIIKISPKDKVDFKLIKEALSCGSKLLVANLSSQLILGVIKLGVERNWDICVFGKVSLAITASNMLMMLANAIGLVFYPMMCKLNIDKLNDFYSVMQKCLGSIMLVMLLVYFPFKLFIHRFMPNYTDAVYYMALAFPSTIFEAKMAILLNNYMKKCREEKWMLIINLIMLIIGTVLVYLTCVLLHNLLLTVSLLVILLGIRCSFVECYIKRKYGIGSFVQLIIQNTMVTIFVIATLNLDTIYSFAIYLVSCFILIILGRRSFSELLCYVMLRSG